MKKIFICTIVLLSGLLSNAQQKAENLCFNTAGELKIAQFTDMHLGNDVEKNGIVLRMICEILDSEKPDLVIFTGDNTVTDDVQKVWNPIISELSARNVFWTAVLGNHDDEHAVKRKDIIDYLRKQPYCIMQNSDEEASLGGDHVISLYGSAGNKVMALLYCLDSNAYSTVPSIKGYGWFSQSQISWYKNTSRKYTNENNETPLPSLAFFHIPLPEYTQSWESLDTKRYGDRNEKECSPALNSGMFLSMMECGDVMGTFVGHDHVNDYIATLYDIALAYGRASGGTNTYGDKLPGSRIVVLKEGKREFETWIRETGNAEKIYLCTYPHSFLKK